jgi:uncharacterized protein (TIGR03083 family)
VDADQLIEHLDANGLRLSAALTEVDWDAPAPGLDWTVRDVVTHVGGVHRWAFAIVTRAGEERIQAADAAMGQGPADAELADWFGRGHAALVAALRVAADDLAALTFLPADSPRHFWARRQAHETAIHCVDVEGALGLPSVIGAGFAADGIDELINGFGRRRSNAIAVDAIVALRALDGPSWELTFGGERIEVREVPSFGWANAMVTGTSSDLYRWLWNRPAEVDVRGDASIAALWGQTVRIAWS